VGAIGQAAVTVAGETAHPLVKYFVDFAGTQSAQWLRRSGLAPGHVLQVYPPHEIQPLFDELIQGCEMDLEKLRYGVTQARRAWLTKEDVLNTLPRQRFAKAMKRNPDKGA